MHLYEEPNCETECFGCSEKENKIDDIKYWLRSIVDQLYSKEKLDVVEFETALQELCFNVNIRVPIKALEIQRKEPKELEKELSTWIQWSKDHLQQLTQTI